MAEMLAAQKFNQVKGAPIETIYGGSLVVIFGTFTGIPRLQGVA
jgi:hypothetical protein